MQSPKDTQLPRIFIGEAVPTEEVLLLSMDLPVVFGAVDSGEKIKVPCYLPKGQAPEKPSVEQAPEKTAVEPTPENPSTEQAPRKPEVEQAPEEPSLAEAIEES